MFESTRHIGKDSACCRSGAGRTSLPEEQLKSQSTYNHDEKAVRLLRCSVLAELTEEAMIMAGVYILLLCCELQHVLW